MTAGGGEDAELVPIDQVARQLGLRASALRYYEEKGLLSPASRHSGRRWYGADEIRRVAVIRYWQESGLTSLDEIAELLAAPGESGRWKRVVEDRLASLSAQIKRMEEAKSFLEHVLDHHDETPDGCPHYEALLMGVPHAHAHPETVPQH